MLKLIKAVLSQADNIGKAAKVLSIVADHTGEAMQEIAAVFPQINEPDIVEAFTDEKQ